MTDVTTKLRQIANGDAVAAAWLYDTFSATLYRRLRRRYGYPGGVEVEDLLQDTFMQALRGRGEVLIRWLDRQPKPPSEAALGRYLWDLACGLATNRRRAQSRVNVVSIERAPPLTERPVAERSLLGKDALDQLEDCLEATNARTYLYFKLRCVDGLTPDEVVKATGWSKKSTYKRKQILDQAIRACLERLGFEP